MVKILVFSFVFILLNTYSQSSDEVQTSSNQFEFDPNGKLEDYWNFFWIILY